MTLRMRAFITTRQCDPPTWRLATYPSPTFSTQLSSKAIALPILNPRLKTLSCNYAINGVRSKYPVATRFSQHSSFSHGARCVYSNANKRVYEQLRVWYVWSEFSAVASVHVWGCLCSSNARTAQGHIMSHKSQLVYKPYVPSPRDHLPSLTGPFQQNPTSLCKPISSSQPTIFRPVPTTSIWAEWSHQVLQPQYEAYCSHTAMHTSGHYATSCISDNDTSRTRLEYGYWGILSPCREHRITRRSGLRSVVIVTGVLLP
ncbi:hypothetical protein Tco_0508193 [Tanacetum coccineum]